MLINNNLSPIPFYESLAEQDFRKWYAQGTMFPLRVSSKNLAPFFFTIPYDADYDINAIDLLRCDDEAVLTGGSYNDDFSSAFHIVHTIEHLLDPLIGNTTDGSTYRTIFYTAPDVDFHLPRGYYYLRFSLEGVGDNIYSELFYVDDAVSLSAFSTKIQWYDGSDIELSSGVVPYAHTKGSRYYSNELYLDTEVGMPEYRFTEEGEERDGRFFPIKQISEKVYKMTFIAPEYMCDCLRLVGLSDVVKITDRLGREYDVEHFEMDVTWLEGGYLGQVDCTFETDAIVKKIGKNYGEIVNR